ncbi:MAG: glycosyltransferase family 2 protein [Pseudomonadota bacterium]
MPHNSSHSGPEMGVTRIREQHVFDLMLITLLRPHRFVAILFWRTLGKRLRARGRLEAAISSLPFAIERGMHRQAQVDLEAIEQARSVGRAISLCIHIHIERNSRAADARSAIKAALNQSLTPECILITREPGAPSEPSADGRICDLAGEFGHYMEGLSAALAEAKALGATWVLPCTPRNQPTRHAIAGFAAHLLGVPDSPATNIVYGDTREAPRGALSPVRRRYWFKPLWDRRMSLSQDYFTSGCAMAVEPALRALKSPPHHIPRSLYDLALTISGTGQVEACCRVVAQTPKGEWCVPDPTRMETVAHHVAGQGDVVTGPFGTTQVRWSLPDTPPTVSVIVATRDHVELLRTCVEGVLKGTDYPALDVIIADNESVEPETLSYMEAVSADPRVQIVRWPHPFNYSAINNFAAGHATGDYLCLLNNDIEVIEPGWLTEMMREAVQPGVGAVGARLLYPDRSIQHAGVAIGIGNAAGHAHRGLPYGEPGYFAQALIARGASAVTAACLVVSKARFDEAGGLDEENLAVAYNDVDLCLKLRKLGLTNTYTPRATLIHHESKSRGLDFAPQHLERYMCELEVFQERWNTTSVVDPWHHPILAREEERYSVG